MLFGKYAGNEIKVDGVEHLIMREDDILGIIDKVIEKGLKQWQGRKPLINLVGNFSYRNNLRLNRKAYADFKSYVKAGD